MSRVFYSDCSTLDDFSSITEAAGNSVSIVRDTNGRLVTRLNIDTDAEEFGLRRQLFNFESFAGKATTIAIRLRVNFISFVSASDTLCLLHNYGEDYLPTAGLSQVRLIENNNGYSVSSVDPSDSFNTQSSTEELDEGSIITIIHNIKNTTHTTRVIDDNDNILTSISHDGRSGTNKSIYDFHLGKFFTGGVSAEIDILDIYLSTDDITSISSIDELNSRVKYFLPQFDVDSTTKPKVGYDLQGSSNYARDITVAGTGSAETDYILPIQIDTTQLVTDGKVNENCSDLIVLDDDFSTLKTWMESPNTTYTTIWVEIPSLPAGGKTLKMSYGNRALTNNSNDNNIFPTLNSDKVKIHLKANENTFLDKAYPATTDVQRWNTNNKIFNDSSFSFEGPNDFNNSNPGQSPAIQSNQINGYPVLRFDGSNDYLTSIQTNIQIQNSDYELYCVEARNSDDDNKNYILGNGAGTGGVNELLQFGYRTNTTFRFGQGNNDLSQTVLGFTSQVWRYWNGVFDSNNDSGLGNGHYLRLNGATVNSNSNTTGFAINTGIFIGAIKNDAPGIGNPSTFMNGDVAEVIIVLGNLTAGERGQIDEYILKKYDLNSTNPTITIGSETFNTAEFSYLPRNILIDDIQHHSKSADSIWGVGEDFCNVRLKSGLLIKPILAGTAIESWSNSTYNRDRELRELNYSTVAVQDTVQFDRGTISDLVNYNLSSVISPNYKIPISPEDIIENHIYIEKASELVTADCKLIWHNSDSSLTYTATLDDNLMILDDGYQFVRIKRSDYVKSGSGDWSNLTHFMFEVKGTTTGKIYHGKYSVRYNFNQMENEYLISNPVRVGLYNSTDRGESWSNKNIFEGRITKNSTSNELYFEASDYLSSVIDNRLQDFSGFESDYQIYEKADVVIGTPAFYNGFKDSLDFILSKIFPDNSIDIDTTFDSTGGSFFKLFNGNDRLGNILQKYCDVSFGRIDVLGGKKVRFRSAREWLLKSIPDYTIKGESVISGSSKSYLGDRSTIVNRIVVKSDHFTTDSSGTGNWSLQRQRGLVIATGGTAENLKANDYTKVSYEPGAGLSTKPKVIGNLTFAGGTPVNGGWIIGVDANDPSETNGSGTRIDSYYYNRETNMIDIVIYNSNNTDRYLKSVTLVADYIPSTEQGEVVFENVESIEKYGLKEVIIDSDLVEFFTLSNTSGQLQNDYKAILNKLKEPLQYFEFNLFPTREINRGDVVKVETETGSSILACILDVRYNLGNLDYPAMVKCIRLD